MTPCVPHYGSCHDARRAGEPDEAPGGTRGRRRGATPAPHAAAAPFRPAVALSHSPLVILDTRDRCCSFLSASIAASTPERRGGGPGTAPARPGRVDAVHAPRGGRRAGAGAPAGGVRMAADAGALCPAPPPAPPGRATRRAGDSSDCLPGTCALGAVGGLAMAAPARAWRREWQGKARVAFNDAARAVAAWEVRVFGSMDGKALSGGRRRHDPPCLRHRTRPPPAPRPRPRSPTRSSSSSARVVGGGGRRGLGGRRRLAPTPLSTLPVAAACPRPRSAPWKT